MHTERHRYLLAAVAAGVSIGLFMASRMRRQRREIAFKRDHASDLKAWENEGGNVAPERAPPMPA